MTYINIKMTDTETGYERIEPIRAETEEEAIEEAEEIYGDIAEDFRIE